MSAYNPHLILPVGARDHGAGPSTAPVTLLEYGDYECPSCGAADPILKGIREEMGNRLRFVFRNFPEDSVHPHAEMAAEAAAAARGQGRFWQVHDRLFEHQSALEVEDLVDHAEALGLDGSRFVRELQVRTYASRVQEDFISGVRSGVSGTPCFYINGTRHDGGYDRALCSERSRPPWIRPGSGRGANLA